MSEMSHARELDFNKVALNIHFDVPTDFTLPCLRLCDMANVTYMYHFFLQFMSSLVNSTFLSSMGLI